MRINSRILVRILIVLMVALFFEMVIMSSFINANSLSVQIAPLNPDFVTYIDDLKNEKDSYPGSPYLRVIPCPIDFNHMKGQRIRSSGKTGAGSFPAYYNLKDKGKVTPVKDQGSCACCWAFATYGSLESNLLPYPSSTPPPGPTATPWIFSENHLKNNNNFDIFCCCGGNLAVSTAYLARWNGPIKEADDPFNPKSCVSPPGLKVQKHIQEVHFLPDRGGPMDNDNIKEALMSDGAVATSMLWIPSSLQDCQESPYFNSKTNAYYCDKLSSDWNNHYVTIVGWDDTYSRNKFQSSTQPKGDGAFIIKNSWGTSWGVKGYFYISYYDLHVGIDNAVFIKPEPTSNYNNNYQYDFYGDTQTLGFNKDTAWMANIFKSGEKRQEQLAAVSFYTLGLNTSYNLSIYIDPKSGPNSGSLITSQNGGFLTAGYYTVKLKNPVQLKANQKFSIVIEIKTPNYEYPIPSESPIAKYCSHAIAKPGESFISPDGNKWCDLAYKNSSVCIKAFTINK